MRRFIAAPTLVLVTLALAGAGPVAAQEPVIEADVRMLDQGAEPRQLLRYEFVEGSTDVLEVDIDMTMGMTMQGMDAMTFELPMGMTTTTTVSEVYEDGSARVEFAISDWDLSGMTGLLGELPDMEESMAMLEGLGGWMVVSPRGAVLEQGMDVPDGTSVEMVAPTDQAVSQVTPLPEEPVGVGARWEAAVGSAVPGFDMELVATSEIVSIDGNVVVIEQDFASDMAPDLGALMGMDMGLGDMSMEAQMSGGGSTEVHLDRVSQPGEQEITIGMDMSMDLGEGMTEMAYEIVMRMTATLVD